MGLRLIKDVCLWKSDKGGSSIAGSESLGQIRVNFVRDDIFDGIPE